MSTKYSPSIAGKQQLKKLRKALAISQGIKLLSTLQQETEGTVSHDQTKRVTYLTELFSRIHREIYQDWKDQVTVNHRPGTMLDHDKRKQFREAIESLVLENNSNNDTAIFDNNGFVISTENIAERLASFYMKMRTIKPFSYGNRLTLDFFMTMLGKLPAMKSVYEQGIDFRRIDNIDSAVLHNQNSQLREITTAFEHALNPIQCKNLLNHPNAYGIWPENKQFVYGIPFLSHTTADGILCLVAVNGGLVPMDRVDQYLTLEGQHLADYPLCQAADMIGFLPGTEAIRSGETYETYEIDGITIEEDGAAPLFCLDINILTGLRSPAHTEVLQLLKQIKGDQASIFDLVKNVRLKSRMLAVAEDDLRLMRAVEIAYERLNKIITKINDAKNQVFEGKLPVHHPKLFMSMGGAGVGKSGVEETARAHCEDNFVIASLDEFRKKSDLYKVLTAANHHSDDYVYVEPFANKLRDSVAEYARTHHFNILYDGTGIPYQPRYSTIISNFKASGFYTQVTAVDAFIIKPENREDELIRSNVISSVKSRFEKTGRALPWVVTVDKHIRAPRSFLNALADDGLDKISLFANDGEKKSHYLVAESFSLTEGQVKELQIHQLVGTLTDHLKYYITHHEESHLKSIAKQDQTELAALIAKIPNFNETNVAYQIYQRKNYNRVLLIYCAKRMVDFMEKRQLNPNASGEAGLLHKPEALAFYVDPFAKDPWLTKLQY